MAIYSDAQFILILQKAARRINRVLCLTGTDEELSISSTTGEITAPLPVDPDMEDLVLMQAECLLSKREYSEDLNSLSTTISSFCKSVGLYRQCS